MSENNFENLEALKIRIDKLKNVLFNKEVFTIDEAIRLRDEGTKSVVKNIEELNSDLDLAIALTQNFDNEYSKESGIVRSLLAKQVETALGVKTDFMERDQDKQITLYESFVSEHFDKMFGKEGYRKIFSGNFEGFMKDFENYGATTAEIDRLNQAINNSILHGEYSLDDDRFMTDFSDKISKGRFLYESTPKKEKEDTRTARQIWEERAYANPEFEPKKKSL